LCANFTILTAKTATDEALAKLLCLQVIYLLKFINHFPWLHGKNNLSAAVQLISYDCNIGAKQLQGA